MDKLLDKDAPTLVLLRIKNNNFFHEEDTVTLFFLFCFISISAHEFWLQPDKFVYKKGEKSNIRFRTEKF
jgi:hypothetical protein